MKKLQCDNKNIICGVKGLNLRSPISLSREIGKVIYQLHSCQISNGFIPKNLIIVSRNSKDRQMIILESRDFQSIYKNGSYDWSRHFENPDNKIEKDILPIISSFDLEEKVVRERNTNNNRIIERTLKLHTVDFNELTGSALFITFTPIVINKKQKTLSQIDFEREFGSYIAGNNMMWDDTPENKSEIGDLFGFTNTSNRYQFIQIHRIIGRLSSAYRPPFWTIEGHVGRNVLILGDIEYSENDVTKIRKATGNYYPRLIIRGTTRRELIFGKRKEYRQKELDLVDNFLKG